MVELPLVEATFDAMGSSCRIVCDLDQPALFGAVHRIEDLESRWSRFRPDSEITRCNESSGHWIEVSATTIDLVRHAIEAHERTEGVFNPMLLGHLEALGYDRSFVDVKARASSSPPGRPLGVRPIHSPAEIEVESGALRLPAGARFDPGGIGKGLAADLVASDLIDSGATWVLVSLGGDMRVAGVHLEQTGWQVDIEDPSRPGEIVGSTAVTVGAIATSSTLKRRWPGDTTDHHHLLDPQTGLPARTTRASATVVAEQTWWADVVAKCLVVDDRINAVRLDEWSARAVIFDTDGTCRDLGSEPARPIVH